MLLLKVCLLIALSTMRRYRFLYFILGCCLVGLEPGIADTKWNFAPALHFLGVFCLGFAGRIL